jgi:large subunit ribosomal protein L9
MEIILLERVEKLGQMGDIVTVKDGYARNYLLPQKKALRANQANKTQFESQRKEIEAKNLVARAEAESVAKKLKDKSVVLLRQAGETGQLYGSVTTRDIAEAFAEQGINIDRGQVNLSRPIKEVGTHEVAMRLHPEVEVTITANVARSNEEAELQAGGPTIPEAERIFETKELAEAAEKALSDEPGQEEEAAEEEAPATEAAPETDPEAAVSEAPVEATTESKPKKKTKKSKKATAVTEKDEAPAAKLDEAEKTEDTAKDGD